MNNLTVIENELVPVYETSTGEKAVYGSELHEVLGVKSNYREWIKRRALDIDAEEDVDFTTVEIPTVSGGAPKKDHIIKLDTAKEMAMLERNEKGKQVRRYFIQIEKKYKSNQLAGLSTELKAVIVVDKRVTKVENEVKMLGRELKDFKMDMPILGVEIDEITAAARRKGVECLGGKKSNAYHDRSLRSKIYHDIYGELKRQFGVSTYKAIKRSQCQDALGVINKYTLPYILEEQIKDCNAQINMEVA